MKPGVKTPPYAPARKGGGVSGVRAFVITRICS